MMVFQLSVSLLFLGRKFIYIPTSHNEANSRVLLCTNMLLFLVEKVLCCAGRNFAKIFIKDFTFNTELKCRWLYESVHSFIAAYFDFHQNMQ